MASDHSLRRLVLRLARLHPDDRAAVFGELEPSHRATIERLLGEYLGLDAAASVTSSGPYGHLSPWLSSRLRGEGRTTDETRSELRQCAATLFPAPPATRSAPSASLLGRLTSWIMPR